MTNYSYFDLFSGAGGWSVGIEAGYTHIGMYDFNESACATAKHNLRTEVSCADLSQHARIRFPEADVIFGSPPCQGFSNEGEKDADDPRNSLVFDFLRIVERVKPRAWVFENVPGFARSYGGRWFRDVAAEIDRLGYKWSHHILDAADYGVPQNRKRFFIMAAREFVPQPPRPTHARVPRGLLGEKPWVTLWEAISDLPIPTPGDRIGMFPYGDAASAYQTLMRQGSTLVTNHTAQKHSERVLEKIRLVPLGGDMEAFVGKYDENAVHYMGGYRRAPKERPSWTAYWTRGMTSIHPEQHRFLTPRECARIQSFPDWFDFKGTTIENYTQICNAVPPLIAQAIASAMADQLNRAGNASTGEPRRTHSTSKRRRDTKSCAVRRRTQGATP